jgi:hypothetical protein
MVVDALWANFAIADISANGIDRLTPEYQDAAIHEAAHAVVAVVMRMTPRKVTIKPRSRKFKYVVGMVDRSGYMEPKTREAVIKRLNKELTIDCSGVVATTMWNDQEIDESILENKEAAMDARKLDFLENNEHKMAFIKQAKAMLLDHWTALRIVADELAEKYTLLLVKRSGSLSSLEI